MLSATCLRLVAMALLPLGLCGSPASGNPTSKEPSRPLAAHGTIAGSKELVEQLYQVFDEEVEFVEKTYARKDDPRSFSDRQISQSAGRLWKARRDAKRLQVMGEPAGYDLHKKLQLLATEVYKFGQAYRGTPEGNQLAQRIVAKLTREKPQLKRFLEQAEEALQKGKLEIFETQMEKKGEELTGQLVYFNSAGSRPFDAEFNAILARGDTALEKERRAAYADHASKLIQAQLQLVDAFARSARRIADEIASNGTATLAEGTTGGPVDSFRYVGSQWGAASAALLRASALGWAFPQASAAMNIDAQQLKLTALEALARVVESAAKSTSTEQVAAVYSGLLEEISVIDRRGSAIGGEVARACDQPLRSLIANDPQLPARIEAYQLATSEVLRWRKAHASQQAGHLGRDGSRASALLAQQGDTKIQVRPPFARQALRQSVAAPPLFTDPAEWMVQEAADRLVGAPIIEDRVVRLTPTAPVGVVALVSSHYANLGLPLPSDQEVADLLQALVVDDLHRPLTLEAANAVSAASMQDYETVMANIDTVHLESIVTRMIGLPDIAYPVVSLGNSVVLNETVAAIDQTCWRFDLRPIWARHTYFTIRLAD